MWREEATHKRGRESFYRDLNGRSVRVGGSDGARAWFERLLAEQNSSCGLAIRRRFGQASAEAEEHRQDAEHLLQLLWRIDFRRSGYESGKPRSAATLWHRIGLCRCGHESRTGAAIALNEGIRRKKGLWSKLGRVQLESLSLAPGVRGDGKICWSY